MSFSAMPIGDMGGQYFGIPPTSGANFSGGWQGAVNNLAQQTQQQANNPVYGQSSPFQPPPVGMMQNFVGGGHTGDTGMRPGVEKGFGMPPTRLQDIAQPGYDDPVSSGGGFGKAMGVLPFLPGPMGQAGAQATLGAGGLINGNQSSGGGMFGGIGGLLAGTPMQGAGQLAGGPAGQPILGGTPLQGRGQLAGGPAGQPITNPGYQGGLRPAPRNYRPPMRRGIMR